MDWQSNEEVKFAFLSGIIAGTYQGCDLLEHP